MTTSATDLVQNTAKRLASEYEVDAGLDRVTLEMRAGEPDGDAQLARKLLNQRINALRSAALEVESLRLELDRFAETLPFTEQGWARRKGELAAELAKDTRNGLASWFEDWTKAAANSQLEALERLVGDIEIPPGGNALRERLSLATAGLRQLDWDLASPAVKAAAAGLTIGDREVPREETKGKLWILLARLALRSGRVDEGAKMLDAAAGLAPAATVDALRARLATMVGEADAASQWLESARAADPTNFDLAIESIAGAGLSGASEESALEMARLTIEALPHIAYSERELRPLRGEVPGVIWLAVAERAYREGDFERGDWAAREAFDSGASDSVQASISQLYADELRAREAAQSERVAALVDAGSRWLWVDELDRAREDLEQALQLEPDHEHGSLLFANTLTAIAEPMPLTQARELAEQALTIIAETRARHEVEPATAWSYLVESAAHMVLAREATPAAAGDEHRWRALEAASRCIVQTGGSASEWQHLACAANALQLTSVAEQAARRSLALDVDPSDGAKTELAIALANAGKYAEALKHAPQGNPEWTASLRAFVALREEGPEQAVHLLRSLEPPPDWPWTVDVLVTGLLLSDRDEEAIAEAEAAYALGMERADEVEFRLMAATMAMILGKPSTGEELLRPLVEEDPDFASLNALGQMQLLRDEPAGVATLVESFRHAGRRNLDDWGTVTEPTLRLLALRRQVELPPLDAVIDAIEKRRAELGTRDDPTDELEHFQTGLAPPQLVALTRTMIVVLFELAQGETKAAARDLEPLLATLPEDREVQLLSEWVEAVEAAVGPASEAQDEPSETAEVEPDFALRIMLPPSWFEGHENPLDTHPIFLRYIPEVRLRAGWEVPGIQITIDDAMEPDKYALEIQGSIVGEGRVELDSLYLPVAAIHDLGLPGGTPPGEEIEALLPGLEAVPRSAVSGLGELLAIPAEELVVRLIGALAEKHAEALGRS